MPRYASNADELMRETRPSRCLRLDRRAGGGATLGRRMAAAIAAAIHGRAIEGRGPDGYWRENAPSTVAHKGFDRPNIETGQMVDERHIAGEVTSTARSMDMVYGTGEADDRGVSDRDRAHYAETGQSHLLIKRPFFWLTDRDCDALVELAGDQYEAAAGGP